MAKSIMTATIFQVEATGLLCQKAGPGIMRPFLMMQYEYKVSAKLNYELWVLDIFFMMWERYFSMTTKREVASSIFPEKLTNLENRSRTLQRNKAALQITATEGPSEKETGQLLQYSELSP
jgi:hypothetical protein